jgi:hydroxyacylglutathione hydrolase
MLDVLHVPAFQDNYIWVVRARGHAVIVDPGDAAPVLAFLERENLTPAAILITHRHPDHVGGIEELCRRYPGLLVYGPAHDGIANLSHRLVHGSELTLSPLALQWQVWETPGHTLGHIVYYGHGVLFCGDTLFSGGCGRLLGGTAQQLFGSLVQLASLPDNTAMYCTHEYTDSNLRFALVVDPSNAEARAHLDQVRRRRAQGAPSLPSTIGLEKRINPFLRVGSAPVRAAVEKWAGATLDSDERVFSALRRWKDEFRG